VALVVGRIEQEAEAQVSWRAAISQSLITLIAPVLAFLDFPTDNPGLIATRVLALAWSASLLTFLWWDRRRPGLRRSLVAFALAPLPLLPMFWYATLERNARDLPLELFFRHNMLSLIYALLTPPAVGVALIMIGLFTAQNLALFLLVPQSAAAMQTTRFQPWTTLLVGVCAAGIALYRARRQRAEVQLIVAREQASALTRLARSFLAVRDLANTPLQTLEISLSLLASRYPVADDLTERMGRSLRRMRELNRILSTRTSGIGWNGIGESFDPVEILKPTVPREPR
jgi:hypothetical protein